MKIAIDATSIPQGTKKGGVACYILNLLENISEIDNKNKYFIFIKSEDLSLINFRANNFDFIACNINSKCKRLIWEQTILVQSLKRLQIELIHSPHYTIPYNIKLCKRVVTFHDMTFFLFPKMHLISKRLLFKKIIPLSSTYSDAIICVSENTAKDAIQILEITPDKIKIIPLGVDSRFKKIDDINLLKATKAKYNISGNFIFYLGTLEPRKNIDKLISAFKLVLNRGTLDHKLVIGGEKGWDYKKLFNQVTALNLNDRIVFTGFIPDKDLPLLYNAADLFVYPSKYEGFGIPVLEAMACGTPIISSNVSSLPQIVEEAGILVNPKSR